VVARMASCPHLSASHYNPMAAPAQKIQVAGDKSLRMDVPTRCPDKRFQQQPKSPSHRSHYPLHTNPPTGGQLDGGKVRGYNLICAVQDSFTKIGTANGRHPVGRKSRRVTRATR